MNPTLYCTKSAADKLGVHYLKILNRAELLKIEPRKIKNIDYWTEDQLKQLAFVPSRKKRNDSHNPYSPDKIKIIELFFTLKENSAVEISKRLKISLFIVHKTINEYIKTKHIIVESKMNKNK